MKKDIAAMALISFSTDTAMKLCDKEEHEMALQFIGQAILLMGANGIEEQDLAEGLLKVKLIIKAKMSNKGLSSLIDEVNDDIRKN